MILKTWDEQPLMKTMKGKKQIEKESWIEFVILNHWFVAI